MLQEVIEGDMVELSLHVRRGWTNVRSVEKVQCTECVLCFVFHTAMERQLCAGCMDANGEDERRKRIDVEAVQNNI